MTAQSLTPEQALFARIERDLAQAAPRTPYKRFITKIPLLPNERAIGVGFNKEDDTGLSWTQHGEVEIALDGTVATTAIKNIRRDDNGKLTLVHGVKCRDLRIVEAAEGVDLIGVMARIRQSGEVALEGLIAQGEPVPLSLDPVVARSFAQACVLGYELQHPNPAA